MAAKIGVMATAVGGLSVEETIIAVLETFKIKGNLLKLSIKFFQLLTLTCEPQCQY